MVSQTVLMDLMKKNVVSKMHIFSNDTVDNSNCEKSGSEAFMDHSCLPEHGWFSCLSIVSSVQGYKCACPFGMTLNKDGRTCESISAHESSIVIATYTNIYRLTHHQIGKDSIFRLPTRNVESIGALAYNPLGHSIVYSDIIQRKIYSMHLDTYRQKVLFENADMVEGLDVDPFTENIYWTEVTRGTVVVGLKNHDGLYDRLVLARNLYSPQGITIGSQSGRMFIVEGRISHVISVCRLAYGWN
jgi:hypothetical protein